jgi:hypothetical protein
LLAVSPPVAARLAGLLEAPPGSIGVLPNPVDDRSFVPAEPDGRDRDELLWVGSLGEHKGIDVLLRAVARLRAAHPTVHLRLVGGERAAGDTARWRALAGELGIGDAVAFEGWLDRPAVAAAMGRAGVLVHPSPSETFGVAAAEAILSGLPVAARRSGGVPWIVELSGGFGAVADGDDAAAFARAIGAVLERRIGATADEARERLVAAIGTAAVSARMVDAYREAIAAAGGPARPDPADAGPGPAAEPRSPLPIVLVATEREQSIPRVAALPDGLRQRVILVVPARADGASSGPDAAAPGGARIVEALPARHERPPKGRGLVAQVRRATWKPPPTADEELVAAIGLVASAGPRQPGAPEVVALDAPAAVLVSGMDARHVRLAPGSLRWLADRWDADRADGG